MLGYDTSGIRSTGRRARDTAPIRTITPESMNIVTGRSIAKRGMLIDLLTGGLRPSGPPCTRARGDPSPHSARVAQSLRSFASCREASPLSPPARALASFDVAQDALSLSKGGDPFAACPPSLQRRRMRYLA